MDKNTIEKIAFDGTYNFQRKYLIKSLPTFVKLYSLGFINLSSSNFDVIAECVSLGENLKNPSISVSIFRSKENLLTSVNELRNLKKLVVYGVHVTDVTKTFIDYISCNVLNLKCLHLRYCESISDSDLASICNLTKLEVIDISWLEKITGKGLGNFLNLKEMHCMGCVNLEDGCLISLLRCAPKLELINLIYCKKITNAVLDVAIEETKKRTNNLVLEMRIRKTSINVDEIDDQSPLLYLNILY